MLYARSLEIEQRLDRVLRLIRTGKYSTPLLAEDVGLSIPTISRCISALRERGHDIRAERNGNGWHYILVRQPKDATEAQPGQRAEATR
jgi:biotin operon repressor